MKKIIGVLFQISGPLSLASSCLLGVPAHAAVFVLKNVSFTYGGGTYSVTGEFKVDTYYSSYPPSGAYNKPSAWNITIASTSGATAYNGNFAYNTAGVTDNSSVPVTPGNGRSFTICKNGTPSCDNYLGLQFQNDFYSVYKDGTNTTSAVPGANGDLLTSLDVKIAGQPPASAEGGVTGLAGQADFVPFSPVPLAFLPVFSSIMLIRKGKAKGLNDSRPNSGAIMKL